MAVPADKSGMMAMDKLFALVTTALFLVLGWLVTSLQADVREMRTRVVTNETTVSTLKAEMATSYVLKEDYRADMREIKAKLDILLERMDRKADRK